MRAIGPVLALRALGHRAEIVGTGAFVHALREGRVAPDWTIILGKVTRAALASNPPFAAQFCAMVRRVAAQRRIFADVCDDLRSGFPSDYVETVERWCHVIASTPALAADLAHTAAHPVRVVPDLVEPAAPRPCRFAPGTTVRLAWFGRFPGHKTGAGAELVRWLRLLQATPPPLSLVMVCEPESPVAEIERAAGLRIDHVPWSLAALDRVLHEADAAILPQDIETAWGLAKSHNRLSTVIQHGRLALASPVPEYRTLADFAWIGDDPRQGLAWATSRPSLVEDRLRRGQRVVAERYGPETIARAWLAALTAPT